MSSVRTAIRWPGVTHRLADAGELLIAPQWGGKVIAAHLVATQRAGDVRRRGEPDTQTEVAGGISLGDF